MKGWWKLNDRYKWKKNGVWRCVIMSKGPLIMAAATIPWIGVYSSKVAEAVAIREVLRCGIKRSFK
nr:hypothetical protein Iba_scaffold61485CG0070 [Ipomoea batatas]